MAIIGIDLGTTNSLGCIYKDGETRLIKNKEGSYLTPSAVSVMPDGTVIVGQAAKERKISHPKSTVLSFKRMMGTDKKAKLGKREFLPEELSSFIIRSIIEDAEAELGEKITEAVISVPAYFHDKQRAATKRAGALAGVKVNRILNEPSAAALAAYQNQTQERTFLVFDFGGGTLDVSMVNCLGSIVEIKGVSGDNKLGGDDFDRVIAMSFLKEMHLTQDDITQQEYAVLLKKAASCKEELSVHEVASLEILIGDKLYKTEYNEERLIKESGSIFKRIRDVIGQALSDSGKKASQIHEIIMVGGSSKMPVVQKFIRHLFHRIPDVRTDCDEMIAVGLGYFCGIMEKESSLDGIVLTDVCPFSLGTSILNPADQNNSYMSMIIPKNSKLPCSKTQSYANAHDMQKKISFDILQGEGMFAKDNLFLGKIEMDITPKPKDMEKIIATFTYDINGILIVETYVPSTGVRYEKVLSEQISREELEERIRQLREMTVNPMDIPKNKQLLEELEKLYVQGNSSQKHIIFELMYSFQNALISQSPVEIAKCQERIEEYLPKLAYWDPLNEVFEEDNMDDWDDPWAEKKAEKPQEGLSIFDILWGDSEDEDGFGGFFS